MTAPAARRTLPAGETSDSAIVRSYPTDRESHIATAARVRAAVPERAEQVEILKALFADGDTLRKRAAEAQARTKALSAPAKPAVRKAATTPMVPIGPAREHVADLTSRGMRQQAIARTAEVSEAAVSMLLRGAYKKGEPQRREITADLQARILAVEFVAPTPRQPKPKPCLTCGEVALLYRGRLTGHATRQVTDGAP